MWTERLGGTAFCSVWALESLSGKAFCSVSPARYAGSSLTCAEHFAAQALGTRYVAQIGL